jgi:hypothetical protein
MELLIKRHNLLNSYNFNEIYINNNIVISSNVNSTDLTLNRFHHSQKLQYWKNEKIQQFEIDDIEKLLNDKYTNCIKKYHLLIL